MEYFNKEIVRETLRKYCNAHALSFEKLRTQRTQVIDGSIFFLQKSQIEPKGLTNDLDTLPFITLILHPNYSVEETEYTAKYLKS